MTVEAYQLPLIPSPQRMSVELNGTEYIIYVRWNHISSNWNLSINTGNDVPIVSNIPFVTGADLLEQFEYLNIKGRIEVQTEGDVFKVPDFTSLGTTSQVFYLVDNDV